MNRLKNPFALALAAAVCAGAVSFSRPAVAQEKADSSSQVKDLDTELAKQMEVMDEAMKRLRRTLRKADSNAESLEWIDKLEKASVKSKELIPAKLAKMPEAEKTKVMEAYKKDMDVFLKAVGEMKAAVKAGSNDKAQEIYKTLKTYEDKGHEKYTEQ